LTWSSGWENNSGAIWSSAQAAIQKIEIATIAIRETGMRQNVFTGEKQNLQTSLGINEMDGLHVGVATVVEETR